MRDLKLTITINKPVHEVFAFTLDPQNTPKWIDSIAAEETSEWPPKLGTLYRNRGTTGAWREFELTAFEPDTTFTLTSKNGYHVRYTFMPLDEHTTEMEYYEWVDHGDLKDFLTLETLEKLKQIIESADQE